MQDVSVPPPTPDTGGTRRDMLIIIGILVVGCCAIVGLGFSGYLLYQGVQKNADSTATAVAATEARQQANTIVTQQAQATATIVARKTVVAGYDFFDTFSDNHNNWWTGDDDSDFWRGSENVTGGAYVWDVVETKQPFVAWSNYDGQESITDFDVTVDARRDSGTSGQVCYGLLFRESPTDNGFDDGAYTFSVCDDQTFSVHYHSAATDWETLIDWTDDSSIRADDWNTIAIRARGDQFTFFINDQTVGSVTDARSSEGYISTFVDIYEITPAVIRFDNFGLTVR